MKPSTPGKRLESFVRSHWTGPRGISGFCDEVGMTRTALYKWFEGKSEPKLGHLTAMAEALRVPRWEIVAAMDGDLDRQQEQIAEEVEAAVAPLRELLRELGLLPTAGVPGGASRGRLQ